MSEPDQSTTPLPPDPGGARTPHAAARRDSDSSPDTSSIVALAGAVGPPRIPGFEIQGEVGHGAMGVVYRARQVGLDRMVALKVLGSAEYGGEEELARFRAEAEAVARLAHPHVVHIFDAGIHDGVPYLALELVEGGTLGQWMSGRPRPSAEGVALVALLADAIDAAHRAGVVHRDLKPANVLMTPAGSPKITDFGLAKRLDAQAVTRTGLIVGTPCYMAPEQATGERPVGPATDVYALGAILYEMLTGRPPFRSRSATRTIEKVISDLPVPPSLRIAGVPETLNRVCLRCLEKDPARRYPDARALAGDLRRYGSGWEVIAGSSDAGTLGPGGQTTPDSLSLPDEASSSVFEIELESQGPLPLPTPLAVRLSREEAAGAATIRLTPEVAAWHAGEAPPLRSSVALSAVLLGLLTVALMIIPIRREPAEDKAPAATPQHLPEAEVQVTASKLLDDYAGDAAEADRRYRGRVLEVSGIVARLAPDPVGNSYLFAELKRGHGLEAYTVRCLFRFRTSEEARRLPLGKPVIIRGRCEGRRTEEGLEGVVLKDCRFVREIPDAAPGSERIPPAL